MVSLLPSPLKLVPLFFDVFEVFVDNLPYFTPVSWGNVEGESILKIKSLSVEPVLALGVSLSAMDVDGFGPFVGIE
jgi:hypothetical protein